MPLHDLSGSLTFRSAPVAASSRYGMTRARARAAPVVTQPFRVTGCGRAGPPTTASVGCLTRRSQTWLARCLHNLTRASRRPMRATTTMPAPRPTSISMHGWTGALPSAAVPSRMPSMTGSPQVRHRPRLHLPRRRRHRDSNCGSEPNSYSDSHSHSNGYTDCNCNRDT